MSPDKKPPPPHGHSPPPAVCRSSAVAAAVAEMPIALCPGSRRGSGGDCSAAGASDFARIPGHRRGSARHTPARQARMYTMLAYKVLDQVVFCAVGLVEVLLHLPSSRPMQSVGQPLKHGSLNPNPETPQGLHAAERVAGAAGARNPRRAAAGGHAVRARKHCCFQHHRRWRRWRQRRRRKFCGGRGGAPSAGRVRGGGAVCTTAADSAAALRCGANCSGHPALLRRVRVWALSAQWQQRPVRKVLAAKTIYTSVTV